MLQTPSTMLTALVKQDSTQTPHPVHFSGSTVTSTLLILLNASPMSLEMSLTTFQRQQHGQQLQMVMSSTFMPRFIQMWSILFLPMMWTRPSAEHSSM